MREDRTKEQHERLPEYDIETLIRLYGNDVLRTAYMYVKDIHIAEDIFQIVFMKVNQKLTTFQGNSSIKTWIIRITINASKDYLKSAWNKRMVPMMEYQEDAIISETDYEEVENRDQKEFIRQTIQSLPEKYKDIVICVYYQDMTLVEASKFLKISEGTAKSRLSRARQRLKSMLEGRISDEI